MSAIFSGFTSSTLSSFLAMIGESRTTLRALFSLVQMVWFGLSSGCMWRCCLVLSSLVDRCGAVLRSHSDTALPAAVYVAAYGKPYVATHTPSLVGHLSIR